MSHAEDARRLLRSLYGSTGPARCPSTLDMFTEEKEEMSKQLLREEDRIMGRPRFFVASTDGGKFRLKRVAVEAHSIIAELDGKQMEFGVNVHHGGRFFITADQMRILPHSTNLVLLETGERFHWRTDEAEMPEVERLRIENERLKERLHQIVVARTKVRRHKIADEIAEEGV